MNVDIPLNKQNPNQTTFFSFKCGWLYRIEGVSLYCLPYWWGFEYADCILYCGVWATPTKKGVSYVRLSAAFDGEALVLQSTTSLPLLPGPL